MTIDAKKTAIVLIEPQNDFLTEGGTMYRFIKDQLARRNVIANLQDLLARARGRVAQIFYVPFHAFEEGFPELKKGGPAYEGLRGLEIDMLADWGRGAWLRGTPGPEIIPQLTPQKGDVVVEGKKTLDAFHSTALDYLLRANEIETVCFTGFHTNWCVESSARSAYDKGYRVVVLGDCTATDTQEEQDYAEKFIFRKIGKVMNHNEFLEALRWRGNGTGEKGPAADAAGPFGAPFNRQCRSDEKGSRGNPAAQGFQNERVYRRFRVSAREPRPSAPDRRVRRQRVKRLMIGSSSYREHRYLCRKKKKYTMIASSRANGRGKDARPPDARRDFA